MYEYLTHELGRPETGWGSLTLVTKLFLYGKLKAIAVFTSRDRYWNVSCAAF
jgi:hypothetical protein